MARFYVTTETKVMITAGSFDEAAHIAGKAARGESELPKDADSLVVNVTNVKRMGVN